MRKPAPFVEKLCSDPVKDWLFIGEAQAGDRSAIIYTVVETCRRHGIDPFAYLKDVLTRLPRMTIQQVSEILPAVWGKPQPLRNASYKSERVQL